MPELPNAMPRSPRQRALAAVAALRGAYPARCALTHSSPLELLVATILSAQTTDERVNMVTPVLFAEMPTARHYATADPERLEELIHATGFFRAKARSLIGMGRVLCEEFEGRVPHTMAELVRLPGVGRKTANVILGVGFGLPGFPVDTHVMRLTNLLGLVKSSDPVRIEAAVCRMVPAEEWTGFSLRLILHGRAVCVARRPRCESCLMAAWCPSSRSRVGAEAGAGPGALKSTKGRVRQRVPGARQESAPDPARSRGQRARSTVV